LVQSALYIRAYLADLHCINDQLALSQPTDRRGDDLANMGTDFGAVGPQETPLSPLRTTPRRFEVNAVPQVLLPRRATEHGDDLAMLVRQEALGTDKRLEIVEDNAKVGGRP